MKRRSFFAMLLAPLGGLFGIERLKLERRIPVVICSSADDMDDKGGFLLPQEAAEVLERALRQHGQFPAPARREGG